MKTPGSCLSFSPPLSLCSSQRVCASVSKALLSFVLRRAKIYLRNSPAFINGNEDGTRATGGRVIFDEGTDISMARSHQFAG